MKTLWRKASHPLTTLPPPDLYAWLCDKSSFMQRLKKHGVTTARIKVLSERMAYPRRDECDKLTIFPHHFALIREVLIYSQEGQWMFARTVVPRPTLTGKEKLLARLKDRSLGSILFQSPGMRRSDFEFAVLRPGNGWFQKALAASSASLNEMWARRSVFTLNQKPLLLTEIFFPAIVALTV